MFEFLFAYLVYNVVVGVLLSIVQLFRTGTIGSTQDWLMLLFFPAVGLGHMRFAETNLKHGIPTYPKKWFRWTYMRRVNWGFMFIIAVFPLLFVVLSSLGFITGAFLGIGTEQFETVPGMKELVGASMILFVIVYVVVMFFLLIVPYLLLVYLPGSQARKIERERMHLLMKQRQAPHSPEPLKPTIKRIPLFDEIETYVSACKENFNAIPNERKKVLEEVSEFISEKRKDGESVNLMFICTHNSRRSQFGQVWAAVAAGHYGIRNVQTFSGGTEETAFNKRAVEAIQRAGLKVDGTVSTNPRYSVRFSDEVGALDCYSKTFDTPANPQKGFVAIMTCSDADEACPIVPGADFRSRITYEDPKVADRTAQEKQVYDERCKQIATEMLYLFSKA